MEKDKMLSEYLEYIVESGRVKSKNTIIYYNRELGRFNDYMAKKGLTLDKVERQDVQEYIDYLVDTRNVSDSSINLYITAIRSMYNWLCDEVKVMENNPTLNLKKKEKKKIQKYLDEEEVERILKATEEIHAGSKKKLKAFVHLLITSGLRISEALNLEYEKISRHEDENGMFGSYLITGKGDKQRDIIIIPSVLEEIDDYYYNERPQTELTKLFVSQTGREWYLSSINRSLKILGKNCGISDFEKIHVHTLRHTFASTLINNNQDLITVKELMGHANISTTQRYVHVSRQRKMNALSNVFQ